MRAGQLRHRIGIQSISEAQNAHGEAVRTATTDETVWGRVEPLTGRELESAQQVNAESTIRVTIRYYSGLTTKNQFLVGTRTLDINQIVDPDERTIEQICLCSEAV